MKELNMRDGDCVMPGAVADDDYATPGGPKYAARFVINGPPVDGRCEICGRHVRELDAYENSSPGEPANYKLMKRFRLIGDECICASWECRDCIHT
jgi:hypothetical protein